MKSQIILAGQRYTVSTEWSGGRVRRFIGDKSVEQFIEDASTCGRHDILADLAQIGSAVLKKTLTFDSPQHTAFALHQARTRAN